MSSEGGARPDPNGPWLLAATFLVAVSGLVYELIAGAASSYLLGDSVTQFSLVIGVFMTSMGIGAWLSRYVEEIERGFTLSQILLGIVGGFSAPILFLAYAWLDGFEVLLFALVIVIGALSGLEIPLITRILQRSGALRQTLANVLTADYAGALVAAVLFPLVIVPQLGLMAASLAFGVLNLTVAALSLWLFRGQTGWGVRALWGAGLAACIAALLGAERIVSLADAALFRDEVVLSEETPIQRIVVTRFDERYRLFLNGAIQFDTLDEHRYHESLVHPVMGLVPRRSDVLILGGGDGMALREVLRWEEVERVVLVDLDPRVTELFREHPDLKRLNGRALSDPRVEVLNTDAWRFVEEDKRVFDAIILDLPDPNGFALSKLYSVEFYARLVERLAASGALVTQAGSPVFAREAFWSIDATLGATRNPSAPGETLWTQPYHTYVPSFGDWGFVIAAPREFARTPSEVPAGLRYYAQDLWAGMTVFARDAGPLDVETNSIISHPLVRYYEDGWDHWFR